MGVLDYVILGSLAVALVLGLWKGFLKQVFAIVGVFVVGLCTSLLSPYPDKWLANVIDNDVTRHVVAIVGTFLVLTAIYALITTLISKAVNKISILGWLNRLLGAIFAVGVVYMVFAVIVAVVLKTPPKIFGKLQGQFLESWSVQHIYGGEKVSRNFFGNWLVNLFTNKIHALFSK